MGNWKELGVVPDSDNEDWDSEEDLQQPLATSNTPHKPQSNLQQLLEPRIDEVWDFPGSSKSPPTTTVVPNNLRVPDVEPQSSDLSGLREHASQSLGDQQSSVALPALQDIPNTTIRRHDSPDPLADISVEAGAYERSLDQGDEIEPGAVDTTTLCPDHSLGNSLKSLGRRHPDRGVHDSESRIGPSVSARLVTTPPSTAFESPARGRRSLRPRKPIQEHPYLLENAQYSKAFKSHGLKPIRIAVVEQVAVKRRHDEDSQDVEYSADESQSGGPDEESQDRLNSNTRAVIDDDLDELALSESPRTSSPQHLRASSEQSPAQHSDNTSVHDDDEDFPDLRDLTAKKHTSRSVKRRTPPEAAAPRKRCKSNSAIPQRDSPLRTCSDIWDLPPSPGPLSPTLRIRDVFSPDDPPSPSFRPQAISRSVSPPSQPNSPDRLHAISGPIELTGPTAGSEEEQDAGTSSSGSDSDLFRRTGRRIRGVLPASWLRLDQQTRKDRIKSTVTKPSPPKSPGRPRQGLASKKTGTLQTITSTKSFIDELEDGDDQEMQQISEQALALSHEQDPDDGDHFDLDGNVSLTEEDYIDRMLPGQKRTRVAAVDPPRKRNKTQQNMFKGQKRYRQPKITDSTHRSGGAAQSAARCRPKKRGCHRWERADSPPALSIVDLIEPNAPKFIRVAARTARKQTNMGRSKPSLKSINLGNRADNLDALAVLHSWTSGKLKPKAPKLHSSAQQNVPRPRPSTQKKPRRSRKPLRPVTSSTRQPTKAGAELSFHQPQRLTRQVSMTEFVSREEADPSFKRQVQTKTRISKAGAQPHNQNLDYWPAQLEAEVVQGDDDIVFGARKKMLDLVFRKSRKEVLSSTFQLQRSSQEEESPAQLSALASTQINPNIPQLGQPGGLTTKRVPRPRKCIFPKRLNLDAPQYVHANDPIPFFGRPSTSAEEGVVLYGREARKLSGLGPFGTQYTHNFDIFPLHRDTFFHHTTIIGDGTLKKALDFSVSGINIQDRTALSFEFADHRFQWGQWTGTTSSELGLLFDAITEAIEDTRVKESQPAAPLAVDGAENVLKYILDHFSIKDETELGPFVQRMSELLDGFINHAFHSTSNPRASRLLVQVTSRLLICALILLRLCQSSVDLSNEAQQAEADLRRLATAGIENLWSIGLSDVRAACDDLHRLGVRERGIRAENVTMTAWVVMMKVLGSAQMPRAGFWDLISSTTAIDVTHVNDVHGIECVWKDLFSLLPLTEFDDVGVLSQGLRHAAPVQGWPLPQRLLKVVFESYQANRRQSPNFNDYCRALLGRCHHLIEQWGWHKCIGIVGTVFDFFGRQSLSNLRNEEVFKSPRFLEELVDGPCLSVEPQDACFHIFLKMLAVAMRSMRRRSLANDIRNLIARCLPNHDRQYSKEQAIYAHDLASLRNHHDLLCTLFWAAPVELRRPVELIEKLVQPASSHKEACLINLRAWSQLARFVVASGSSFQDYRPFISWQNNVFQQVLNQYLFAASDVEHQFMSMAKEDRGSVQQQFLDSVIAANQSAAKDVLYFSVMASQIVMKHCLSLTASTFSFNVNQMSKVFSKLSNKGADLDWGLLRACFDTVDVFVKRIEEIWITLRESSSDSVSTNLNREVEDAVDFLDDKVMQSFMNAVRKSITSLACASFGQSVSAIVEKAIILCGRIASLFIDGAKCSIHNFFAAGKYNLFGALPHKLSSVEWRFVPLFVATLLKNHVFNFSSIGCTHFDIWIACLVRPHHALPYAVALAKTLKTLDMRYMDGTGTVAETALDYDKNRTLFASGVSYMRRELLQAGPAQRKSTKAKYEKLLKAVMQQIKSDLKSLKLNSAEHSKYISFVREVIGLIKSHAADICSVDPFFFQVSAEYSPPREDPQMHAAGVLAYGIRLGEGDTTAIPQLFHYLYSHFKTSLSTGQLGAESRIIENGMRDGNILAFVIGRMLPAIIRASSYSNDIWPLLGTYSKALHDGFTRSCLPREIPESSVDDIAVLLTAVLDWTQNLGEHGTLFTATQAQIFTDLVGICNTVCPSLTNWLQQSPIATPTLQGCCAQLTRVAKQAAGVLDQLRASGDIGVRGVPIKDLVSNKKQHAPIAFDSHVNNFTQMLIGEVRNSWVVTADTVTVKVAATPSTQRGTQATQGISNNLHSRVGLLSELLGGLKAWISEMGEEEKELTQRRRRRRQRCVSLTLAIDPF